MTTTFETMVKISFELSNSELKELFSALNCALVSLIEKRDTFNTLVDDSEKVNFYNDYYSGQVCIFEKFVSNFNPENFDVKELQQISKDGSSCR